MKNKITTPRGTFEVKEWANFTAENIERLSTEGFDYWFSCQEGSRANHIYIKQEQLNPEYKVLVDHFC